jgi:hypothetical protein
MRITNSLILVLLLTEVCALPAFAKKTEFVITQRDEDEIKKLIDEYNKHIKITINPVSSHIPFDKLAKCDAYDQLIKYDAKIIPYIIRQGQIEQESRVLVGSALAQREIKNLQDLNSYQKERKIKLRNGISPCVEWPGVFILPGASISASKLIELNTQKNWDRFSWIEWWEKNHDRFEFKTDRPVFINTKHKYYSHPHVSTEVVDGLLYIEAVSATYRQMIERVAAEMGIDVFIGEQLEYMRIISTVRMRAVTFEEFAYLIGRTVYVEGFKYRKIGNKYHFGGKTPSKPRRIMDGWGIMMNKTVFHESDPIPVTIITRGTGVLINPSDTVFVDYGSFKITTNDGRIIKDYNNVQNRRKATKKPLYREKDCTEIDLLLNKYIALKPGEYNLNFRYLSNETPSIAIEVYKKSRYFQQKMKVKNEKIDQFNILNWSP